MSYYATYRFPQLKELPDGLPVEMFRRKSGIYPGMQFKATDTGEYHMLMFQSRESLYRFESGDFHMYKSDIIVVRCKKIV